MIVAVANQKGGVGKSTTVAALALNLGKMGKRVLVIDMDPQANCTTALGIPPSTAEAGITMTDVLLGNVDLTDAIQKLTKQVHVAPAHISMTGLERMLYQEFNRERILARHLRPVAGKYDIILLDSPPSLGIFAWNVLAACDTVLVPIQCEPLALDGITLLLNTLEDVREYELNPKCDIGGVVLTMFDQRRNVDKRVKKLIEQHFSDIIFETVIPRDVKLVEFSETADRAIILDGDSQGAAAYRKLAEEVAGRWLT